MKKTYLKPKLIFEDFTLMDALATNCSEGARVNHADGTACYLPGDEYFPENVFIDNSNCFVHSIEAYEILGFSVFTS